MKQVIIAATSGKKKTCHFNGLIAKWLNAVVCKTAQKCSGVRIPLNPPDGLIVKRDNDAFAWHSSGFNSPLVQQIFR